MKKTTSFLLLTSILFLSSMIKKPSIDVKSFVNTKLCVDDTSITTTLCFKKDNTFWHYRINNSKVDSFMFSKWGIEGDKIYLFDDDRIKNLKFAYMKIVSCNNKYITIEDLTKKQYIKLRKIDK